MDSESKNSLSIYRIVFLAATLALAGVFFVAAVFAGRAMIVSGHLFHNNALFGVDTARNLQIMIEPGIHNQADLDRSNVHPFFAPLVKPWVPLLLRLPLGLTPGVAAMIVCAAAGACALLLAAWFFRRRGLARPDAWLLTLLLASSATWVCMSAIPGSYIFSLNFIILSFILTHWTLARPDARSAGILPASGRSAGILPASGQGEQARCLRYRWAREAVWLAVGLLNYGITITNGFISFLAYGFARRGRAGWLRAALYGALVIALGTALAVAFGSHLNFWSEKQWIVNDTLRAGTPPWFNVIVIVTPTLWSLVVPWPVFHWLDPLTRREPISGVLTWSYTGVDWALAAACAALLVAGLWAVLRDRDPLGRRLSAALAAALAFHIVLHRFYFHGYEGVFFFTPHSIFMTVGLLAPLFARAQSWPAPSRTALRIFLLLLGLTLAIRNYHYFFLLRSIVPLPQ